MSPRPGEIEEKFSNLNCRTPNRRGTLMTAIEETSNLNCISNDEKLAHLNQMVENWRSLFDESPNQELKFWVNAQNILCLNDTLICNIADIDAYEACCDYEALFFESTKNGYYRILITWDFANNVYVREVALVLYDGT
jgi:hypothetical protein